MTLSSGWRETSYKDRDGRWWQVLVPSETPDSEAHLGIPVGPPSLETLGLPERYSIALHNELFHRKIFTEREARRRASDIASAIRSAFSVDVQEIISLYRE